MDRKSRLISVWVTEEMYERLKKLTKNEKGEIPMSEIVRRCIEEGLKVIEVVA